MGGNAGREPAAARLQSGTSGVFVTFEVSGPSSVFVTFEVPCASGVFVTFEVSGIFVTSEIAPCMVAEGVLALLLGSFFFT